jgi:transposase
MLDKNLTFGGVFFMSKYSNEFKLKVVNYCLENNVGYRRAANYFNIPSKTLVKR